MKIFTQLALASICILLIFSCKKDDKEDQPLTDINQRIITGFSSEIAFTSYSDLANATSIMNQKVQAFSAAPDQNGLLECQNEWKKVRKIWEQTEAYLFGPAATENIDPRIDTWPVNFNDLEGILNSSDVLNEAYINNLDDALKGFHPAEYLLFGINGNKNFLDFTPREFEFLEALVLNLKSLTAQLASGWNPSAAQSFYHDFTLAGNGSSVFLSERAAFEELVGAMSGICDEVANGKIAEPFLAQNPDLEESPYSKNSITDFTNNIKGVQNVYLGKYITDGVGLEDLVRSHNLSLDATIKLKLNNAITSLNNITDPFGTAIFTQPIQVQNAIDAINELKEVLDEQLLPLVQITVN